MALIEQVPVRGSRRDHYRMRDDAWATLMTSQNTVVTMMQDIADAGLAAIPGENPATERRHQMRDFYAYMLIELPALIDRWHRSQNKESHHEADRLVRSSRAYHVRV